VNNLKATPVEIQWHSGLPIYASAPFLKLLGEQYGWVGGVDDAGRLRCVLPYTIVRKPGFRMVRFRAETIPWEGEVDLAEEMSFLNSAIEYFRSTGADMIIPSGNTAIFRTYPEGAVAAPYGTYVIDLTQPEDVLQSKIQSSCRNNIRKAIKEGVKIKSGVEYLDICHDIITETLKRSGSSFRKYDQFRSMVLGLGENVKILVAEYQGVLQGCMVAPFSEYSAYASYCGSKSKPVRGAMQMLHWEAMLQFRAMGVKRFDFQGVRINPEKGSKQEGIMTFKRNFGGELVSGYMWKYSLHPLKWAAYSVAVRLLLGGDIVDREHSKLVSK
jgi:peptidoglycan biosynthesis/recognition FemAB-like protein